ncbi:MAG: hypothetical protein B6247_25625 [Candidatus Parabeggiatoa sp. nov. 2]|nr:MAG: hypothetical protein B6247_25625 [Beggiatoa sp. 4572_84]
MNKKTEISIVIPIYGCAGCLHKLIERLEKSLSSLNTKYEVILVDDRSKDNAWHIIESIALENSAVKGIRLSRNFGQHFAITAGLEHADGEWVVVMDCDLQDKPEEIPKLYQKAKKGYDIVYARRVFDYMTYLEIEKLGYSF